MAKKKKSTTVRVNFKGVEGRKAGAKPGEYIGEVEEATLEEGDKAQYIAWTFKLGEDGDEGKAWFNTSLSKQALWNLRGLLEAMGEEVPDDAMDIDLEDMIGKKVGVVIEMDEYEGKEKPKMVDYMPVDDISPTESTGKKKKKKGKKLSKDDVERMDRDELEELIKDHELDIDPDDFKKDKKLLAEVLEKLEEGDLLEEESDKLERDTVEAMDQKELEDLIKEHKLDVDLEDFKTLKKMVKAVIEALEADDLL